MCLLYNDESHGGFIQKQGKFFKEEGKEVLFPALLSSNDSTQLPSDPPKTQILTL